jgi:hypothetical protein
MKKVTMAGGWMKWVGGLALALALLVAGLGWLAPAGAQQALAGEAGLNMAYLPWVPNDAPPPLPEFVLRITPAGGLTASTYTPHSFQLSNNPASQLRITQVRIDLSTAAFMDMVYDPFGLAGDFVSKDVTIDYDTGVGFAGRLYDGFHDDGYDILTVGFNDFDPGEEFHFSVDVDPTSIRGVPAPGPYESGSVSGMELSGATVSVIFENGLVLTGRTWRMPGSLSGSELYLRAGLPPQPAVSVVGQPVLPATVSDPNQVVRVSGPAGQRVTVLVIEGGQFTDGLPGGGFDIDPYEANSALGAQEFTATMWGGSVDIPITLSRTHVSGGYNMILVVFKDGFGLAGPASPPIVLRLVN